MPSGAERARLRHASKRVLIAPGHTLVVTRRVTPDWFTATEDERGSGVRIALQPANSLRHQAALLREPLDRLTAPSLLKQHSCPGLSNVRVGTAWKSARARGSA